MDLPRLPAGKDLFYLHVQGEIAGANAIYGLDEVPEATMPAPFWTEFPRKRGLRPRTTTSQVLNRLGAWGFRLVAFAPAIETHAEHLARLFYPNSIYLRPVSKYFPMFYWIVCRDGVTLTAATSTSVTIDSQSDEEQASATVATSGVGNEGKVEVSFDGGGGGGGGTSI